MIFFQVLGQRLISNNNKHIAGARKNIENLLPPVAFAIATRNPPIAPNSADPITTHLIHSFRVNNKPKIETPQPKEAMKFILSVKIYIVLSGEPKKTIL